MLLPALVLIGGGAATQTPRITPQGDPSVRSDTRGTGRAPLLLRTRPPEVHGQLDPRGEADGRGREREAGADPRAGGPGSPRRSRLLRAQGGARVARRRCRRDARGGSRSSSGARQRRPNRRHDDPQPAVRRDGCAGERCTGARGVGAAQVPDRCREGDRAVRRRHGFPRDPSRGMDGAPAAERERDERLRVVPRGVRADRPRAACRAHGFRRARRVPARSRGRPHRVARAAPKDDAKFLLIDRGT